MKELNINSYVNVKINNYGISILEQKHNEFQKQFPIIGDFKMPEPDENGYIKFQLWELMNIFGPYLIAGFEVPFEMNIGIDENDLTEIIEPKIRKR